MKTQYSLTDEAYANLIKKVSILDLMNMMDLFSPNQTPASAVSLMFVYDKFGNFLAIQNKKPLRVAKAVFDCMDAEDKVTVMTYINDQQDDEDE